MPASTVDGWFGKGGKLTAGAFVASLADAGSTRSDADPRASLRPLAIAFSAVLLLVNIPLSFMGSLYSWVVTLVAFIVLWLPVYTGLFEDKS